MRLWNLPLMISSSRPTIRFAWGDSSSHGCASYLVVEFLEKFEDAVSQDESQHRSKDLVGWGIRWHFTAVLVYVVYHSSNTFFVWDVVIYWDVTSAVTRKAPLGRGEAASYILEGNAWCL